MCDLSRNFADGKTENVDLSNFFSTFMRTQIRVDSEQQRLYSAIGTTYELCKICDERNKNVRYNKISEIHDPHNLRLEPCDHLLCSVCLKNWQECSLENSTLCPFCREPIRGTDSVVIRSYPAPHENNKAV